MTLHIILQPEPGKEAAFFEIEPPFENPEIYTTLDKFREDEFLRLVCDAYQVATGRQVKAYYDRDVEDVEAGAFSNVFFEPKQEDDDEQEDDDNENYNESWETYQAVKAERAKRDAWAMGE